MAKRFSLKIETTYGEQTRPGLGTFYLNQGEIAKREGIGQAVGCLFAPLGAAIRGASKEEIEALSAISRTQLELHINLALARCQENLDFSSKTQVDSPSPEATPEVTTLVSDDELEDEEYLDFDEEEL
jgi:hypothetical protein